MENFIDVWRFDCAILSSDKGRQGRGGGWMVGHEGGHLATWHKDA